MCSLPRALVGVPRIAEPGRHLVYQGDYGQYAIPDTRENNILQTMKPAYAIRIARKLPRHGEVWQ